MRRNSYGLSVAVGVAAVVWGCSSDDPPDEKGTPLTGGTAGSSVGGRAGSSSGGTGAASTGGAAGSTAGASMGGTAGSSATGGSAGATGGAGSPSGGSAGTEAGTGGEAGAGCSPAADDCPSGSYCTAESVCAPGCKDGASCASGVCGASHDCEPCVVDGECAAGLQCATGVCSAVCEESVPESCGGDRTCCETRCVDTARDIANCGDCGMACNGAEFCGPTGCLPALVANVCDIDRATALLDGQVADDAVAADVLEAIAMHCSPAPLTQAVDQSEAEQINPATGQIVASGGELLIFAGGPYFHKAMQFLETQRATPVYSAASLPQIGFYRSADDVAIITSTLAESTPSHDIIVVQIGREAITGTPSLILYGYHESGTRAAAWQFINVILPQLSTFTAAYYVYEWTDGNDDLLPDAAEFELIETGP